MARDTHHERLSSLDATFLGVEDRCSHMHIGSVGVFEGGPGGGIDLDRVHHLVSRPSTACRAIGSGSR